MQGPLPLWHLRASCILLPSSGPHHPLLFPETVYLFEGLPLGATLPPRFTGPWNQQAARHKFQDGNKAARTLSTPDTRQEHGSLKDTGKGTDDGLPSPLLWTLESVLSLTYSIRNQHLGQRLCHWSVKRMEKNREQCQQNPGVRKCTANKEP